jgi:hypothetical protein
MPASHTFKKTKKYSFIDTTNDWYTISGLKERTENIIIFSPAKHVTVEILKVSSLYVKIIKNLTETCHYGPVQKITSPPPTGCTYSTFFAPQTKVN